VGGHRSTAEWRWHLGAAALAAVLAIGGAHVTDRVVPVTACRLGSWFDQLGGDPEVDGKAAAANLLRFGASLRGLVTSSVMPPQAVPGHQRLMVGQTGTWEVVVLQVTGSARTLEVDYGDGGIPSRFRVPPGAGACVFSVSRSFSSVADERVLTFTVLDHPSAGPDGPPSVERTAQASVDVVERP